MQFKRVKQLEDADSDAILVTLYRCDEGHVRGWYIGPLSGSKDGVMVPYVPRSHRLLGMVAVLRAREIANRLGLDCYVIDPDDLWSRLSEN